MRIKAYSRDERKVQVLQALAIKAQRGEQPRMTMYQIAKRLDLSPSTHLMNILKEMEEQGMLQSFTTTHRPNMRRRVWELKEGSYQLPMEAKREIPIKAKGEKVGVFSL